MFEILKLNIAYKRRHSRIEIHATEIAYKNIDRFKLVPYMQQHKNNVSFLAVGFQCLSCFTS